MKKLIIKELKKCTSVRNKEKTWISKLDDELMPSIMIMFLPIAVDQLVRIYALLCMAPVRQLELHMDRKRLEGSGFMISVPL